MRNTATVYFSGRRQWTACLVGARERIAHDFGSLEECFDFACGALGNRGGGQLTIRGRDGMIRVRAAVPSLIARGSYSN